jgi:hypothetical protein
MRRKTIKEKAGVHFGTAGLWSYVRPFFASPAPESDAARLGVAEAPTPMTDPGSSCLVVSGHRPRRPRCFRPALLQDLAEEKSVHIRPSAHCCSDGRKTHRGEKFVHFSSRAPLFLCGPLRKPPSARPRAIAVLPWASRQELLRLSPSGTHRDPRLNKKSCRILAAQTTDR